jgi:hypothetical protein
MGGVKMLNKLPIDAETLKKGCLIASVAHAISLARFPDFAHEQSWDSYNYSVQSGDSRGTLSFVNGNIVGAFRKDTSKRIKMYPAQSAGDIFESAGGTVKEIAAGDTLEYLYFDIEGSSMPVATTTLWGNDEEIFSNDTYEDFLAHGGDIITNMLLSEGEAVEAWCATYGFTANEKSLLKSILDKKEKEITSSIMLSYEDYNKLGFISQEAKDEFITSLKEINIFLPTK